MAVERDDQRHRFLLPGVGNRLPDDLLVPQVHAVKDTDGQADLSGARLQFVGGVDEFHSLKR